MSQPTAGSLARLSTSLLFHITPFLWREFLLDTSRDENSLKFLGAKWAPKSKSLGAHIENN